MDILDICIQILKRMDIMWTFLLLITRFGAFMMIVPGLGLGDRGIYVRYPAVVILAFVSLITGSYAALPTNAITMIVQLLSEFALGFAIGLVPFMIVAGVQMAGQLITTSMGLGAGNLIDPTLGAASSDIARIFGDLCIVIFLMLGGHHIAIYAVAGLGGDLIPGTFLINDHSMALIIDRSGDIFRVGVMLAAPVLVAVMLTNVVMGLLSKAVPTVNIFIISFPLTIGIGMVLTILALPETMRLMGKELNGVDRTIQAVTLDATRHSDSLRTPPAAPASDQNR